MNSVRWLFFNEIAVLSLHFYFSLSLYIFLLVWNCNCLSFFIAFFIEISQTLLLNLKTLKNVFFYI